MAIDEADARIRLFEAELSSIESGIRAFDAISFQVKGWCVTATLAIASFAASGHKKLLVVGAFAIIGFWLVDSQNRQIQRAFLRRNRELRTAMNQNFARLLDPSQPALSIGLPSIDVIRRAPTSGRWHALRQYTHDVFYEGFLAHTIGLYLFLLAAMGAEAIFT